MNLRSFLYRPLTPAEMQEVCRYYLGKAPSCVQLLEGGLFHTTYCVEVGRRKDGAPSGTGQPPSALAI